ncbi:glycoside hydrolase family 31 protein [Tunturibacter empetritectus]|uniref:Alpha-D-xyloside xylohydrolase n=1 Tax=Tunturiibacter empetritectus TaxID=3069691 RepID=A0A7W8MSW9_9BACT|nr:glycoside hydrolase family 31 protein [Edaphobacter lichenicola]MBB5319421.1 alpha-D-xyloside xylohydrolase [Edaphobacter lichenicola]
MSRHIRTAVHFIPLSCLCALLVTPVTRAQQLSLSRDNATVLVEPYAPNIVRVSISLRREDALAAPGYGIVATPAPTGWTAGSDTSGDTLRSNRLVVTVSPQGPKWVPTGTSADIAKFFNGSTPGVGLSIKTPNNADLVRMQGWQMSVPNHKDGNADILYDRRSTDAPFFQVGASFASPPDEHYYGLGQNQEGYLDHRNHVLRCAHDYNAPSGQSVCVPFIVTNKGYGILWDNPSATTVAFGFNDQVRWTSDVGQRVSFFVIAGATYDEIYAGYRLLTGSTPMLPKSAYGYIQSKQRYTSQAELLGVAHGYRERHYPIDDLVIDWFHYTIMGQMDMDPTKWPDPAAMNKELHALNFHTMISIWPRFVPEGRYYNTVLKNGWFEHLADGTPTNGLPYDRAGSDIDITNPDAAKWYWDVVKENYISKGFDAFWADETEPDLPPNGSYFHIGPGTQFFNIYPLFHTAAFYNGFREDLPTRALILARDAYLGAQHNGAIFWSSDISGNWDTLKRQVPTGINFVASGTPYWSTDIGGWQYLPSHHTPLHTPLIDPSDARENIGHYDDYPELYVRWFEYGAFQPNFRSHGSRPQNEVWSYGKQAEPILVKYLRLRYQLMPYIYSLGHMTNQTGAPFMRGLFMDFGSDPKVANIADEYMFGPALLVAPVTEQGSTSREVYLPAGTDWYNFWTNTKVHGGQTITVDAPIDTIPLFVRAGSIIPLGSVVESTNEDQKIDRVRVYPGADGDFDLYRDDGNTYNYEKGQFQLTHLHWSNATAKLTHSGPDAWSAPDASVLEVENR